MSTMDELSAAHRVLGRMSAEAFVATLTVEQQNALRKALDVYGPYVGTWVCSPGSMIGIGDFFEPFAFHFHNRTDRSLHVHVREFKREGCPMWIPSVVVVGDHAEGTSRPCAGAAGHAGACT